MKNKKNVLILALIILIGLLGLIYWFNKREVIKGKIVINEAIRTLLYLPLYHAKEAGFFKKNGIEVEIVTGGTATNSFAAMTSGEADFSQADPMYVPISNEKQANTRVVAQVVSKIAVWGITMDTTIKEMNALNLKGKKISTQVKPMTAYTYTIKAVKEFGLDPEKDVEILQNKPGTEIQPLLLGQANFAFTLEPNVSNATSKGAKVVLSYPKLLGEQIFTGLMAKNDFIDKYPLTVVAVLKSYQESMNDIYTNRAKALTTAKKYFPQLNENVLKLAIDRILNEEVMAKTINISNESWDKAIKVRLKAGDLKTFSGVEQNVRTDLILKALEKQQ